MDAKEYIDTLRRICSTDSFCDNCDFKKNGTCPLDKRFLLSTPSEDIVSFVEQWAKDHPVKTRKSEFLKMFPKAEIKDDYLWMCPKYINYDYKPEENCYKISCCDCKRKFWLEEVTDND